MYPAIYIRHSGKDRVVRMSDRENRRKGRYNGNSVLLMIMIGFCILAVIEIIYGQIQIRMQKERLALEEENRQVVQELKEEWDQLKGEPNVGTESSVTAGEGQSNDSEPEKTLTSTGQQESSGQSETDTGSADGQQAVSQNEPEERKYDMQIVFLGDSILDSDREDNGVASLISDGCNAKVYNMAMGGTTAALMPNERYDFSHWDSRGLLGVVNAILGNIGPELFEGYKAGEILKECDFSKTDFFVIEYGINDFLSRQVAQSKYLEDGEVLNEEGVYTYTGALDTAVCLLKERFPDAGILLISPHYCQIFEGDKYIGDSYSLDYGCGTMVEFARGAGYVAGQHEEDGVMFYYAMDDSGIDAYNADKCLEDGIHLTEEGRIKYAEKPIRMIKQAFFPEE